MNLISIIRLALFGISKVNAVQAAWLAVAVAVVLVLLALRTVSNSLARSLDRFLDSRSFHLVP